MGGGLHQDAIKLGCHKGQAWLRSGLSKGLVLHLELPQRQAVLAEEAGQRATAILNGKLRAVLLRNTSAQVRTLSREGMASQNMA